MNSAYHKRQDKGLKVGESLVGSRKLGGDKPRGDTLLQGTLFRQPDKRQEKGLKGERLITQTVIATPIHRGKQSHSYFPDLVSRDCFVAGAPRNDSRHSLKAEADNISRIVILGLGNVLLKDEGVGIHVIHALQDSPSPPDIDLEVIDGGTSPDALCLLDGVTKLIIIDAVKGGSDPGSIYRFRPAEINLDDKDYVSLHQIGILESLRIMECMGKGPEDTVIIGVEPKEIVWGLALSPELEHKVPQIVKLVMEEARRC